MSKSTNPMTPPQSTGFAAPTDESVAGLVARLTERWESTDAPVAKKVDRLLAVCREAATALPDAHERGMDAGVDFLFDELSGLLGVPDCPRDAATETWDGDVRSVLHRILTMSGVIDEDTGALATARAEASEARATALEAERDIWQLQFAAVNSILRKERGEEQSARARLKRAERRAATAEAQLARAREALETAQTWHESEDKALSKSGRSDADYHWRRLQHREQKDELAEALRSPAPADGRGDDELDAQLIAQSDADLAVEVLLATPTPDLPSEARADGVENLVDNLLANRIATIIEQSLARHGVDPMDIEGTLDDAGDIIDALTAPDSSASQSGDA